MRGAHPAIAAFGVNQIGAGDEGRFFIVLGAGFKCGGGLRLERQNGLVDLLAPLAGACQKNGNTIAQSVGGDDLALSLRRS